MPRKKKAAVAANFNKRGQRNHGKSPKCKSTIVLPLANMSSLEVYNDG
jgi:hypothetical protein